MLLYGDFPGGSDVKDSACNAGHVGLIPGSERSSGEGNGYPLQYSGLENSMDSIVRRVAKSRTGLSDFHLQTKNPRLNIMRITCSTPHLHIIKISEGQTENHTN